MNFIWLKRVEILEFKTNIFIKKVAHVRLYNHPKEKYINFFN